MHGYFFYMKLRIIHKSPHVGTHMSYCLQFEATTRTEEQSCQGSTTLHAQGVRTGVPHVTIRMERTMTEAGVWQVLVGMVTGGVLRAQVSLKIVRSVGELYLENSD